jgi:hypothetical protein
LLGDFERSLSIVFEIEVLRKIFQSVIDDVIKDRRRLHSEELHNLYSSPNIDRVIKSRRIGWAEHVAHIGEP